MNVDWDFLDLHAASLGLNGFGTLVAEASLRALLGTSSLPEHEEAERLIGERAVAEATDRCLAGYPTTDSARSVLQYLRPLGAMQRCYDIFRLAGDAQARASAVRLLQDVGDRRALAWVGEFLADNYGSVQEAGASVLEYMAWAYSGTEDADLLLEIERAVAEAAVHGNQNVRVIAATTQSHLRRDSRGLIGAVGPGQTESEPSPAVLEYCGHLMLAISREADKSADRAELAAEITSIGDALNVLGESRAAMLAYEHAIHLYVAAGVNPGRVRAIKDALRRLRAQ